MAHALFSDIVTVYNRIRDGRTDTWQRTVLRGVQVRENASDAFGNDGVSKPKRTLSVTIPSTVDAEAGRRYLMRDVFQAEESKPSFWTLDALGGLDVIVPRECCVDVDESHSLDVIIKEGGAVVLAVTDNRNRPLNKHIKVVCG